MDIEFDKYLYLPIDRLQSVCFCSSSRSNCENETKDVTENNVKYTQQKGATKCGLLCTNQGRYCMTDPDFDTNKGVSGADVVTESLRQKCIWNAYGGQDAPAKDQVR